MCDYSLHHVNSRPARSATSLPPATLIWVRGVYHSDEKYLAVCLLPGTELSFADEVRRESSLSRVRTSNTKLRSFGK